MKLLTIKIISKGIDGLETEVLDFGNHITQLHGPTGTGKTPIIKSIAYCLGCSVVFRQEIYNRCEAAVLTFQVAAGEYTVKRFFIKGKNCEIEVTDPSGKIRSFYDEANYSSYIFDLLGLENRELISTSGDQTSIYLSTLLPLFYVTQDEGYSSVYRSENSFIKDQFSEMIRFTFSLPEKNSFNVKKNQVQAKQKLDVLDALVAEKSKRLKLLRETITSNRQSSQLHHEIEALELELNRVSNSNSGAEEAITSIEQILNVKKNRAREVLKDLNSAKNRRNGLLEIKADIETEINTLSLNEEARRIFLSFQGVCSSDGCQLFSRSSDAFSKNLLYLKDQIKDLEGSDIYNQTIEVKLSKELELLNELIAELERERDLLRNKSGHSAHYKVVSDIKLELFKLHSELADVKKVEASEKEYIDTLNRRGVALDSYDSYSTSGKLDLRLSDFRKNLRLNFISWLGELKTSNISHDITFKNDFEPVLGEESVKHIGGSTGSRTVLAFHAALFELAAGGSTFKFLILDAPKQHETENIDLDNYMLRLKDICIKYKLQTIFSATEYEYKGDDEDRVWKPQYLHGEKMMFMRKPLAKQA